MTLREQLLSELRLQNDLTQKEINQLEENIKTEAFLASTVTSGAIGGAAKTSCYNRMNAASAKEKRIKQENTWISEMLSKYK